MLSKESREKNSEKEPKQLTTTDICDIVTNSFTILSEVE